MVTSNARAPWWPAAWRSSSHPPSSTRALKNNARSAPDVEKPKTKNYDDNARNHHHQPTEHL